MNNLPGTIIIIVAPSGTGKSTLIKKLKSEFPVIEESVSYTTRGKREGEVDGVNYFFINVDQFNEMKDNQEFLESATVHSNFYGTSKSFVTEKLSEGKILLFDLDVQGAEYFKDYFGDKAKAIFLEPPSIEELEKRLKKRGTEPMHVIEERIKNAKNELKRKNEFDFLVVNNNLDLAYHQLKSIVSDLIGEENC